MNEYGVVEGGDSLRFERILPGPIERVWSYLTEGEQRAKWLAGGLTEPRVGGVVRLEFDHDRLTPHDDPTPARFGDQEGGVVHTGEVLRYEPPHVLSHTWEEGDGVVSEVTFELTAQGEDVLLVLTHARVGDRKTLVMTSGGWHAHLDILAAKLSDETPGPFWAAYERLEADYEKRIAD